MSIVSWEYCIIEKKGVHCSTHLLMLHQSQGTVHTPSEVLFSCLNFIQVLQRFAMLDDLGGIFLHGLGILKRFLAACLVWIGRVLHHMLSAGANVFRQLIELVKLDVVLPLHSGVVGRQGFWSLWGSKCQRRSATRKRNTAKRPELTTRLVEPSSFATFS